MNQLPLPDPKGVIAEALAANKSAREKLIAEGERLTKEIQAKHPELLVTHKINSEGRLEIQVSKP
jgi:hypothetical protein